MRQWPLALILLTTLVLCARPVEAQRGTPSALNPKDYTSPSGQYQLTIDPSDLYGRGAADYRVTSNGTVVWQGKQPFTLCDAGITDAGLVAGYAYTHGIEGHFRESGNAGYGEFHVVIMRATGEIILDDVTKRTSSRFLHTPPNPLAKGLAIDAAKDRLFVIVRDEDVNRRQDFWWAYDISSGKRLGKTESGPRIPVAETRPEPEPAELVFPIQPLKLLGTFTLREAAELSPLPVRDIWSFDFNEGGQIGFIRKESPSRFAFVLIAPDGSLIRETPVAIPDALATNGFPKVAWVEADRWVIAASAYGVGAKSAAWWLNASNGILAHIAGFDAPFIHEIAGSRDGGFVALATHRARYSMEDQLVAFKPDGSLRWRLREDNQGREDGLFSPKGMTVTSDKRIAVVDVIRHTVQYFSTNRSFLSSVKLDGALGRKANYPSDIAADKEGGVLIHDFRGQPPLVRLDARGKVIAQFQPKHPDGRRVDPGRGIKVAPSGRVWVCDGDCLLRLNDEGVVDLALGAAPRRERLHRIAAMTIDPQGRIYAADDRTGAVHVYDPAGVPLRICQPDPADIEGKLFSAHLTAAPDGTVYFSDGDSSQRKPGYIQYAPDGRRLGRKKFDLDSVREEWHVLPHSTRWLVLGYRNGMLADADGKVARTIQRRPDRNWLEVTRGASVAPDGTFAILSGGGFYFEKPWHVSLYNAAADPVRMLTLPSSYMDSCFTYTGRFLATRTATDICLLKATGEPVLKFTPDVEGFKDITNQRWASFAPHEGRELWFASLDRKMVWRFELPPP